VCFEHGDLVVSRLGALLSKCTAGASTNGQDLKPQTLKRQGLRYHVSPPTFK
jgi:hypothetical protein